MHLINNNNNNNLFFIIFDFLYIFYGKIKYKKMYFFLSIYFLFLMVPSSIQSFFSFSFRIVPNGALSTLTVIIYIISKFY